MIQSDKVRVIDENGENLGVMYTKEAMEQANELGLNLVEVSPNADPPVAKYLDVGKYRYEAQKKANAARKTQKTQEIKEIKMRPNIDVHDYDVKMRRVRKFLEDGDKDAGSATTAAPLATEAPITRFGDTALNLTHGDGTAAGELRRHLARLRPTGYASLQAYIAPTPARDEALARIRTLLRDSTHRATTLGYGPRFLHSTGQLHKGGAPIGPPRH